MSTVKKWEQQDIDFLKDQYMVVPIADIAKTLNRSDKSIIAKLVSLGMYVKPAAKPKEQGATQTKLEKQAQAKPDAKYEVISTLAILLGVNVADIASLVKANKNDLVNLQQAVIRCAHFKDNKK